MYSYCYVLFLREDFYVPVPKGDHYYVYYFIPLWNTIHFTIIAVSKSTS